MVHFSRSVQSGTSFSKIGDAVMPKGISDDEVLTIEDFINKFLIEQQVSARDVSRHLQSSRLKIELVTNQPEDAKGSLSFTREQDAEVARLQRALCTRFGMLVRPHPKDAPNRRVFELVD